LRRKGVSEKGIWSLIGYHKGHECMKERRKGTAEGKRACVGGIRGGNEGREGDEGPSSKKEVKSESPQKKKGATPRKDGWFLLDGRGGAALLKRREKREKKRGGEWPKGGRIG